MDSDFEFSDEAIRQIFVEELSREWYDNEFKTYAELPQQGQIQTDIWTRKISQTLQIEKNRPSGPFKFVKSEMKPSDITGEKYFDWSINSELTVRFTFSIDRVDMLEDGKYRFVDYKTGSEIRSASSLDELFHIFPDPDTKIKNNKVIFQLLAYAHAFEELMRQQGETLDEGIKLEVIKIHTPADSIDKPLIVNRHSIATHRDEEIKDFLPAFKHLVERIFDPSEPFSQTPNESECLYCQFKNICRRNPDSGY